jgi:hypothetical protein
MKKYAGIGFDVPRKVPQRSSAVGAPSASAAPVFAAYILDGTKNGKAQYGKNHDAHGNGSKVICYHVHSVPHL